MNYQANIYKILIRAYKDDQTFTDKATYYKKKYIETVGNDEQ